MNETNNAMKDKEACDTLSNGGFTAAEIARLQQLRQGYVEDMSAANRRHEVLHWLGTARQKRFGETSPEWTKYQ